MFPLIVTNTALNTRSHVDMLNQFPEMQCVSGIKNMASIHINTSRNKFNVDRGLLCSALITRGHLDMLNQFPEMQCVSGIKNMPSKHINISRNKFNSGWRLLCSTLNAWGHLEYISTHSVFAQMKNRNQANAFSRNEFTYVMRQNQ